MLRCADGTLYTGITTDVERRLREHNGLVGGRRGAAYTRARRPVRLAFVDGASGRADALRRELAIKRLPRTAKERLVRGSMRDAGRDVDVAPGCKAVARRPPSTP